MRVLVRVGGASPLHVGVGLQRTDALWVSYRAGWHCVDSTAFNLETYNSVTSALAHFRQTEKEQHSVTFIPFPIVKFDLT